MGEALHDSKEDNFVSCIHRVNLQNVVFTVTVTWAKTLMTHYLYMTAEIPDAGEDHYTCKIDLKTWQFWGKKGLKITLAERKVDVFWDLRGAKFTSRPEPDSDYYVAMVSKGELVLLLGDQKKEALKRSKSKMSPEAALLVHRKEIVYAKRCFCTKTTLGQDDKEHDIVLESCLQDPFDPEMWIRVDEIEFRVPNLHWRFRGNETIAVDDFPVEVLWDVHDWLYSPRRCSVGIFVFRRGGEELGEPEEEDALGRRPGCFSGVDALGFCHFIYAWKTG